MSWKGFRASPSLVVALIALVVAASGGAWAATRGSTTITVCVHHGGGTIYQARRCRRHDRKLSWNARGPQGAPGAMGPAGPTGAVGPATGPAGGDLTGSYPNPTVAPGAIGTSKMATLPGAAVHGTAGTQTIHTGTPTKITLTTAEYDPTGMFDPANSRLVIKTPGTYYVQGDVMLTYSNVANQAITVSVDDKGAVEVITTVPSDVGGAAFRTITASGVLHLAAGDDLTLNVDQTTGADATSYLQGTGTNRWMTPRLAAQWLGP